MGLNQSACGAASGAGCNWTVDSWCSGQGNSSDWCQTQGGGWCDYNAFKSKNCWLYMNSSSCGVVSGCNWFTDQYSQPHCEIDWSTNCAQLYDNSSCSAAANCQWRNDSWGGWCTNKMDECWSKTTSADCNILSSKCYWQSWGSGSGNCQPICFNETLSQSSSACGFVSGCSWREESGWCQESAGCWNFNQTGCTNATGQAAKCRWKDSGWCDPLNGFSTTSTTAGGGGGGSFGGDCWKYNGNQSYCINQTLIGISCSWMAESNPRCEVNWGGDCWQYSSTATGCNSTNGCWYNPGSGGSGWCTNIMDQCWSNTSYQSWDNTEWLGNCTSNSLCTNNSWGGCEPVCFNLNSTSCANATYSSTCKYMAGWCNPSSVGIMFNDMQAGAPAPLGADLCPEIGIQSSVDICGFGMKDMGNAFGFGLGVNNFENSSVCNKEKISSNVMGMAGGQDGAGAERVGTGNDTVIYLVYLDTDGSTTGGCALSHNSSAVGYEFRFKYSSEWDSSLGRVTESFNSYECSSSDWKATDIKISSWKKMMCSEIGGPMIGIEKADLSKYPALYDSTKDMRVYVVTIGNTGNISNPTDTAGPGWTTPGSVDFDIFNAFSYGADTAKFEDILKYGFVKGEDCFNSADDDSDGLTDCTDYDCQFSSKCSTYDYSNDTRSPQVTGVKIEEYTDGLLIMYDTNKPTNGTLEWYGADSRCSNSSGVGEPSVYIFPDIGIVKSGTIRQFKTWHTAAIYEGATKMNSSGFGVYPAPLVTPTNSYYKLKVCDQFGKCAVSKCSSFKLPPSTSKCSYCNFVTRIKAPTGWTVSYDTNLDGTYSDHIQGQVCGPNAGMKTNYTMGRRVNIKLSKDDGTTYIEFLNASLTKTGLNDKVRTISTSGDIISSSSLVGLTSETRDKIINNLHPEACRIKVPVASGGTCDKLYHCDDSGANCVDRTTAAGGIPVDAATCVWNVPYCEFSTYKVTTPSGSISSSSSSSSGGSSSSSSGGGDATTSSSSTSSTSSSSTSGGSSSTSSSGAPITTGGATSEETGGETSSKTLFLFVGGIIVLAIAILVALFVKHKRKRHYGY